MTLNAQGKWVVRREQVNISRCAKGVIAMIYLGIDVAKAKLDCCLLIDADSHRKRNKVVPNSPTGIEQLLHWLTIQLPQSALPDIHAVMESTGIYHAQAAQLLHQGGMCVSIVNPAHVRHMAKGLGVHSKNDSIDSHVLARYGHIAKPGLWHPASQQVQQLTALLARRACLYEELQREHARLDKLSSQATHEAVSQSLAQSMTFLDEQIKHLDSLIEQHIDRHPDLKADQQLLLSIPAVGPRVACQMLSLMHTKNFNHAEQLAAYIGLVPVQRQSGTSVRGKSHLSKAGPSKLRATLYMAAMGACRCNPHIKAHYQRLLAAGKSKSSALGAAMRKLVHLCFGVLHTRQPYRAEYVHNGRAADTAETSSPSTGAATVLLGAIAP
jgi:transposase